MARVTITINDNADGTVDTQCVADSVVGEPETKAIVQARVMLAYVGMPWDGADDDFTVFTYRPNEGSNHDERDKDHTT